MLRKTTCYAVILMCMFFGLTENIFAFTGIKLAEKIETVKEGFNDSKARLVMTLINAEQVRSEREIELYMLEGPEESSVNGDKTMMFFLTPPDVRGTGLLTYERFDRTDDQWLYMPAIKRVKRIATKNKSGSFMGSEFSYEDISSQSMEKYSYSDAVNERECNGKNCYTVERYPRDSQSGYTKQIVWVDEQEFTIQKIQYFDRKSELLKTAEYSGYKKLKGKWRVGKILMTNHQTRKKTVLEWKEEDIQTGLSKVFFSKRNLMKWH